MGRARSTRELCASERMACRGRRSVIQSRAFALALIVGALTWAGTASAAETSAAASITIQADKVEGHVSPMLYGQFDEFMYEGVKFGLHAEMIRDRSFEDAPNASGLPRYWERDPDDRNDDSAVHFYWDNSVSYPASRSFKSENGDHSLRVTIDNDDGQRRGIRQGSLPVRQGLPYHGYLWLKTSGFEGGVTVALEADWTGGERYSSAEIRPVSGDWKSYPFTLTPVKSDPLAKFVILLYGRGRLWIDQVSLMPGDSVDGVREDVFEKGKALRPAFLRWPGGNVAQDYHWMWGIGPRDQRFTWTNLSWGNELEPSDFGTDEFVRLCRNLGAAPSITVNVEGRGATADEAAAWVEYANGPASSRYGTMRAANGHPEPFGVKYWEIGNEIWGSWVRAHSDAETYARNYVRYADAIRHVDSSVRLIGVGDNNMSWNQTVLRIAGSKLDYLAIHHYYGLAEMRGDERNLMAHPLHYEQVYKQVAEMFRELAPGRAIKLAVNEWNTSLPVPRQRSMESGLYAARLMNVFERSDIVAMSAVSDFVNGWPGGVIQSSRHGLFVTPTYLVNELYSRRFGTERLAARVQSPVFDTTLEGNNIPYLDAVVTRTSDGKQIFVKAVNTDPERTLHTSIELAGAKVAAEATIETINAESLAAANSFESPDAVSLRQKRISAGTSFVVDLPSHSVSVITLDVAP
jgi:alpha-N-arabinofuranosidase